MNYPENGNESEANTELQILGISVSNLNILDIQGQSMRFKFRCDCGNLEIEETIAKSEVDKLVSCEQCGHQYVVTVTRLGRAGHRHNQRGGVEENRTDNPSEKPLDEE